MSEKLEKLKKKREKIDAKIAAEEERIASQVLKPKQWKNRSGYFINVYGGINGGSWLNGESLFYGKTKEDLEPVQKQLTYNSIIHNLKHVAGCGDYEFVPRSLNYYIYLNNDTDNFDIMYDTDHPIIGSVYFPEVHADAILEGFKAAIATDERLK